MKTSLLPGTAVAVSELCLGTMTWGEQTPETEAHAQLDCAVAKGVNFIDTAECIRVSGAKTYGRTETILGAWLARRPRDKLIVASKVAGPGRSREWVRGGETALTRKNIKWAIDDTLRRLRTDYVDLYQIHWPERNVAMFGTMRYDAAKEKPATPILEQIEAMDELIRAGKVRHYGLSNETAWGVASSPGSRESRTQPVTIRTPTASEPHLRGGPRGGVPPRAGRAARLQPARDGRARRQVPRRRAAGGRAPRCLSDVRRALPARARHRGHRRVRPRGP
jgi:aryl-alcohol dehydrogenase-like predicted oxidoreductase